MSTTPHLGRVKAASIRVAAITTAIVAAVYAVIAVTVVVIVTRNLTSNIDSRLTSSLSRIATDPFRPFPLQSFREPGGGPRFGPPLLIWVVQPSGLISGNDSSAPLPDQYRSVRGPQTISIGGADVRVTGTGVGGEYVVVGQSTDSVSQARSTLVLAEVLVGPALLAIVFLGALTIGRRVAAPIEVARQRQMEFTADASHELRTPLSVIEAQTSLALAHERDTAWYRSAFTRVDGESKRMRRLVEDLLWLARFDSTRGRPAAEYVDVGVMAWRAVDRFGAVAEASRLALTVHDDGQSHIVNAPPEWLDRLLGVLLDNACKYAPEGGSVEVTVSSDTHRVLLRVDDSGPGIPVAERAHIFDRFHRATERSGGAGLGLAIADAVVRATGGRWDIGDSPAGGASLAVSWPRRLSAQREPAPPLPAVGPAAPDPLG